MKEYLSKGMRMARPIMLAATLVVSGCASYQGAGENDTRPGQKQGKDYSGDKIEKKDIGNLLNLFSKLPIF